MLSVLERWWTYLLPYYAFPSVVFNWCYVWCSCWWERNARGRRSQCRRWGMYTFTCNRLKPHSISDGPSFLFFFEQIFTMIAWAILFIIFIASQRTAVAFVTSLVGINIALIAFGVGLMTGNAKSIKVS